MAFVLPLERRRAERTHKVESSVPGGWDIVMRNAQAWWHRATTALAVLSLVGIVACSQQTEG
jgi:hypothetical protein